MGSGAYAVDLTSQNVAAGTTITHTLPLPPAGNSGTVKFANVFLSLSANPSVGMQVTLMPSGQVITLPGVGPGRTGIGQAIQAADQAAVIQFNTATATQSAIALVEFSTP